jgi:hypothetical protein
MIGDYTKSAAEWKKADPLRFLEDDEPPAHRQKLHKLDAGDDD